MKRGNNQLGSRYRTAAYLFGVFIAIGAIAWAEGEMWQCIKDLRQRTETMRLGGFHLSDQLEVKIRTLNDDVVRYSFENSPERKTAIESETEGLRLWLAEHRKSSRSPSQQDLLGKVETLYARYAAHAGLVLHSDTLPTALPAWRTQKESILAEILGLAHELNRDEKASLATLIDQTQHSVDTLYRKLIVSSVVLLSMGAVLSYLIFRGFILPLRFRLRQSQFVIERQEKLSSLGVLAAGVAHEIRNPLTSIKARLYTQQSVLEQKSEALEDNVFITEEISRLEKIVADFLAFARPSDPSRISVHAAQLFRDLEGLLRPALAKANIELKKEFQADPVIQADPAQLKQVLINLVQNAAESIGRDGTIVLRTRTQTRRRVTRPTPVVILEVSDTGNGIPPDVQQRLFDPFFTTKASGTGLGLSIAARILEKHGGALEYQTVQNRGTTFRLVLPWTPPSP